jgi:hypothetical protein
MPKYYLAYCPHAEGTNCQKGTRKLGSYYNKEDAREAIFKHLVGSIYHGYDRQKATKAADDAELCEMEYEDEGEEAKQGNDKMMELKSAPKASATKPPIGASSSSQGLRLRSASQARDRSRSRDMPPPQPAAAPRRSSPADKTAEEIRRISAARLTEIVRSSVGEAIRDITQATIVAEVQPEPNVVQMATHAVQVVHQAANDQQAMWNMAVGALVKVEAAARTTSRIARQAAEAFEDQAHILAQQISILQRTGYMPRQ